MIDGASYPRGVEPTFPPEGVLCRDAVDSPGRDTTTKDKEETDKEAQRGLLCRLCHLLITTTKERVEKDGTHLHTFFNPAGIVYEIGCFRNAPGCIPFGAASREFPWFSGYSWQVVYCRGCQQHLGWRFSGEDQFFGLIVNKLAET